jgi:hypothetical protein
MIVIGFDTLKIYLTIKKSYRHDTSTINDSVKSSNQQRKIRKRAEGENPQIITGSLRNVTRPSLLVTATPP